MVTRAFFSQNMTKTFCIFLRGKKAFVQFTLGDFFFIFGHHNAKIHLNKERRKKNTEIWGYV
jgi:hypothetical protein